MSFTLDYNASPKTRPSMHRIILTYKAKENIQAEVCESKSAFYAKLQATPTAVFYTRQEEEVIMKSFVASTRLQFIGRLKGE